ncbi:unnamed protein product [Medioppia subpectinata]|uniref:BTB domain-containing protein n=1 Tax=Medioppia subpectinata TaxID=1979941 RepID=A0A7R9Q344_9ACAR|nr:unnamed protein product [Medioppia subpectinata]CAG2111038.1 unnamed protein product [Medioppia subpectinata]
MADNGSQEEDNQSIDASISDSDEEMSQQMDSHSDDSESDDNEIGGEGQSGLTITFNCDDIVQQTSFDSEDRYPELWYYLKESESDFILIVNGQRLPANRRLLMERSVVFREMLTKYPNMKTNNCMDATVGAIETMLRFMLTERLVFNDHNDLQVIADALCCARGFRVNRLVDAIGRHLVPMISADTIEKIAEMAFKCRVPGLSDAIDDRLDELLTVANVLSVTKYSHKCGPPSDRFTDILRAFLVTNYQKMKTKKWDELRALNASTKDLWLEVMVEMSKSGVPLTQDVHSSLSSDELRPLLTDERFLCRVRQSLPAGTSSGLSPANDLSAAIRSRQLGPVVQDFGLGQECVDAANAGDVEDFANAYKKLKKNYKKSNPDVSQDSEPKRRRTRSTQSNK